MHPCLGNWVAIGRVVVYYARATHAFSAGIKCRHSRCCFMGVSIACEVSVMCDGFWWILVVNRGLYFSVEQ